jgi:hypothetical protein
MRLRLFFAAVAVLGLLLAGGLVPNPAIEASSRFNRDVAVGMGVVYTSLRVLKGVLNMAADANFSAGVAVVNFEGSPGQLVTPVIDTIERMANLVFALMIYSGLLAVLIPALGTWAAGAVGLAAVVLVLVGMERRPPGLRAATAASARALLLIGLVGAVVLPSAYALSGLIGDEYLRSTSAEERLKTLTAPYEQSQAQIVQAPGPSTTAPSAPETGAPADQSIWDYISGQIQGAITSIGSAGAGVSDAVRGFGAGTLDQISASIGAIGDAIEKAEELLSLLVDLAVAYIFKLFVLPVVTMAVILVVGRVALRHARGPVVG